MKVIGAVRGKHRNLVLHVDDAVPLGFMRVGRAGGDNFAVASGTSWAQHAAENVAAAYRPGGLP